MQVQKRSRLVVAAVALVTTATACGGNNSVHAAKVGDASSTPSGSDSPSPSAPPAAAPSSGTDPSDAPTTANPSAAGALPQGPARARLHYRNKPPTDPTKRAVYYAYSAYADMVVRMYLHPNASDPSIAQHATGQIRARIVSTLQDFKKSSTSTAGPLWIKPTVTSVTGSVALVTDCADGRQERNYRAGRPLPQYGTRDSTIYQLIDGPRGWAVSQSSAGPAGYCA